MLRNEEYTLPFAIVALFQANIFWILCRPFNLIATAIKEPSIENVLNIINEQNKFAWFETFYTACCDTKKSKYQISNCHIFKILYRKVLSQIYRALLEQLNPILRTFRYLVSVTYRRHHRNFKIQIVADEWIAAKLDIDPHALMNANIRNLKNAQDSSLCFTYLTAYQPCMITHQL